MLSFVFAVIAGAAMSVQGVWNTRLGDKIGLWEGNALVQCVGFVLALAVMLLFGRGNLRALTQTHWLYWLGGVLAPVITVTVMLSLQKLDTTVAISVILIAQLLVAALIDALGLFGQEKATLGLWQYAGVALMLAGVLTFKLA